MLFSISHSPLACGESGRVMGSFGWGCWSQARCLMVSVQASSPSSFLAEDSGHD